MKRKNILRQSGAAPSIRKDLGFLKERKATSYPSKEAELFGAEVVKDSVVVSDFIITSRGLGTAIDFSLALIGLLLNKEKAEEIKGTLSSINVNRRNYEIEERDGQS